MNKKKKSCSTQYGSLFIAIFIVLFLALWIALNFDDWQRSGFSYKLKGISAISGIIGYLCLSISLLLSSRWKRLENWFGGLDQIYRIHRLIGIYGFFFILIHPFIFSIKWIPERMDKLLIFYFPIHHRLAINLGSCSFWLMIIILIITISKILPYDKWKILHKCMTLVYILAFLHFFLMNHLFGNAVATKLLLLAPTSIGLISILFKQLIYYWLPRTNYKIVATKKLNDNLLEITFEPLDNTITFIPGQYAFFSFQGEFLSKESHPFTLCGDPNGKHLSILVKSRGDFTALLYEHAKNGYIANIEGPYGKFDYTKIRSHQVWVAGGIGIVPFLVWARNIESSKDSSLTIDLFYATHSEKDALFHKEFLNLHQHFPSFRFFPFCSEKGEHLTVDIIKKEVSDLAQRSILMCGPKRLTQHFLKEFLKHAVRRKDIYFEDFEFF